MLLAGQARARLHLTHFAAEWRPGLRVRSLGLTTRDSVEGLLRVLSGGVSYTGGLWDGYNQITGVGGGGVTLAIVKVGSGLFTFQGLDFLPVLGEPLMGPPTTFQTIGVYGLLNGNFVGSASFTALNTNPYGGFNWVTFGPSSLNSINIDALYIGIAGSNGIGGSDSPFSQSVRNVQLGAAVPEPATWALVLAGFGLIGGALRRRPVARARCSAG